MKLALAMYTVYENMQKDLFKTLKQIKQIGYEGVEMYGDDNWAANEINAFFHETNLKLCGWHTQWSLLQDDTIEKTIEFNKCIGNQNIVIPCLGGVWNVSFGQEENTSEMWHTRVNKMNEISKVLNSHGLRLGYHTHDHEYKNTIDNQLPWDILLTYADENIFMELDTGNCLEAGYDVKKAIKQAKNRLEIIHCKPFGRIHKHNCTINSEDDLNPWKDIVKSSKECGCSWLAVENEAKCFSDKLSLCELEKRELELYLLT